MIGDRHPSSCASSYKRRTTIVLFWTATLCAAASVSADMTLSSSSSFFDTRRQRNGPNRLPPGGCVAFAVPGIFRDSCRAPAALVVTSAREPTLPRRSALFSTSEGESKGSSSSNVDESMPFFERSGEEKEKQLSPEAIAEMIEVSFVQSCMQLASGYVDVLKLFLAAVKAGYERGTSLDELVASVEGCGVKTAGRDLAPEEKALRNEWMEIAYRMLRELDHPSEDEGKVAEGLSDGSVAKERVQEVVEAMVRVQNKADEEEVLTGGKSNAVVSLKATTVEAAVKDDPTLSSRMERAGASGDAMEKALLTNAVRVALTVLAVLDEERVCLDDGGGGEDASTGVPRPPIPGT